MECHAANLDRGVCQTVVLAVLPRRDLLALRSYLHIMGINGGWMRLRERVSIVNK